MKKIFWVVIILVLIVILIPIVIFSILLYPIAKQLDYAEKNPIKINESIVVPPAQELEGPKSDEFKNLDFKEYSGKLEKINYKINLPAGARRMGDGHYFSFKLRPDEQDYRFYSFYVDKSLDEKSTLEETYKLLMSSKDLRLESLKKDEEIKVVNFKGYDALYIRHSNSVFISIFGYCGSSFGFGCSVQSKNELENFCPLLFESFEISCSD